MDWEKIIGVLMETWKWMLGTLIGALAMTASWFAIANSVIDNKIESKLEAPKAQIYMISERLEKIDNKLDRLIERK